MAEPFAHRRTQLRKALKKLRVPAALISHPMNVRYLSGFTGDSTFLILSERDEVIVSDTRYETQIAQECPGWKVEIRDARQTTEQLVARVLARHKLAAVTVEADHLTKAQHEGFAQPLKGTTLVDSVGLVQRLRAVKDKKEIELIRGSIRIAQRAFESIRAQMVPLQSEKEIAAELEYQIRRLGGEGCSFPPIVGVGARAALPHGRPGATALSQAPFVLIDWGATVCGYMSDLTRVVVTGPLPPKFNRVYQTVLKAQQAAIELIRPGAHVRKVDQAARSVIADAGFGKYFGHGLGHGFGLEIHELPRLSPLGDMEFQAGMVVTVEPGIYLPDWGGIRIEDDVLVTHDGCEVLSQLPRDWESLQVDLS